mgnify:CR=1 FL=1
MEKEHIKPLFAFGHGLSYTTFKYGKPSISTTQMTTSDTLTITIPITNIGKREGAEVVQLYIADKNHHYLALLKNLKASKKFN